MSDDLRQAIARFKADHPIAEVIGAQSLFKRASSAHGGELVGPCPLCGGNDRLSIYPDHDDHQPGGFAICRKSNNGCPGHGDTLRWAMLYEKRDPEVRGAGGVFLRDRGYLGAGPADSSAAAVVPREGIGADADAPDAEHAAEALGGEAANDEKSPGSGSTGAAHRTAGIPGHPGSHRAVQTPAPEGHTRPEGREAGGKTYPPIAEVLALWDAAAPVTRSREACELLEKRAISPRVVADLDLARVLPRGAQYIPGGLPAWASAAGRDWIDGGYRLILPARDLTGAIRSLRAWCVGQVPVRPDGSPGQKRTPPKGYTVKGLCLADAVPGISADVVITEGEPDYLTAAVAFRGGGPLVIGIWNGGWSPEWAGAIRDGSRVVIHTDPDPAGDRYAQIIAASLQDRPVTVVRGVARGGYATQRITGPDSGSTGAAHRTVKAPGPPERHRAVQTPAPEGQVPEAGSEAGGPAGLETGAPSRRPMKGGGRNIFSARSAGAA